MNSRFYEEEKERILAAVRAIMDHFPQYVKDCDLSWPICPYHRTEMCQILKRGESDYFECFEITDELKPCGHREFSI